MAERTPAHLRPTTALAPRVLLPGDPHRALAIAQSLLDGPLMFNHTRGLWGYTGTAPDGEPVSVQSTGMGGPSAAIVVEELIDLGAQVLVRVGTCGALVDGFALGDLVVASEVLAADGASRALGAPDRQLGDSELAAALEGAGARPATAVSTDLFYDPRAELEGEWVAAGAEVVEMEAATLLAVAARRGVRAAVLLGVTDLLAGGGRERADAGTIEALGPRLGDAGFAALR